MFARSLSVLSRMQLQLTPAAGVGAGARAGGVGLVLLRTLALQQPKSAFQEESRRFVHIEKRLEELGIDLPPPSQPKANYNICCYSSTGSGNNDNNVLYVSGHLPTNVKDGTLMTGKIGPESEGGKSVDHGYDAARMAGLAIISTLKEQLGDLDKVDQVVKIFGIVQSTDTFKEQHLVMNGCSDVFMEIFGKPTGYHARSAIGTNTLPLDVSVEIEAVIQLKP